VHGEYRTKRLLLEAFDAMQQAMEMGAEYQTVRDPPPGQGPRHQQHTTEGDQPSV
jgi:hypothetical protein